MNPKRLVAVSKFLSKHLRHAPADIGLTIDPAGWVGVSDLLAAADRAGFPISRAELAEVVAGSDKQRFALDEAGDRVRANQGHSVPVDLGSTATPPPETLYHGTAERHLDSIRRDGLRKMQRHHVHLSADAETARKVGVRHGKPVVLTVASGRMAADGLAFFVSDNGVWLVDAVPPQYLSVPDGS